MLEKVTMEGEMRKRNRNCEENRKVSEVEKG